MTAEKAQPAASATKNIEPTPQRLARAVMCSDRRLAEPRKNRQRMVQSFAGGFFGLDPERERLEGPLNPLYAVASVMMPHLAVRPAPMVTTRDWALRPMAKRLELALELIDEQDRFAATCYRATMEAMFLRGIVWTGLCERSAGAVRSGNYLDDPGRVSTRLVREGDFVEDMTATSDEAVTFRGHRFRVPYEWARDSGLYDSEQMEALEARSREAAEKRGAWDDSATGEQTRWIDEVELLTLWLPRHGQVVTLPGDLQIVRHAFLREADYYGPEGGPYDKLQFTSVPDCLLGVAPMATVYALAEIIRNVAEKLDARVAAIKDVGVFEPGNRELADTVSKAADGEGVEGNAKSATVLKYGGNIQELIGALDFWWGLLNRVAGNPDLLGGLNMDSPTAAQDAMKMNAAETAVGDKREKTLDLLESVYRKRAWFVWNDRESGRVYRLEQDLGAGVKIPVQWNTWDRQGDLADYVCDVQANRRRRMSPDERYRRMMAVIEGVLMPLAAAAERQGKAVDVERVFRAAVEDLGIEELSGVFVDVHDREAATAPEPHQQFRTTNHVTVRQPGRPAGTGKRRAANGAERRDNQAQPATAGANETNGEGE